MSRIILVGHCGPDMFMLRTAVARLAPGVPVETVNDRKGLDDLAGEDVVLLVNRVLDGRFSSENGIELIRELAAGEVSPAMLLVSNYADAQQEAVQAGALPGFGKSELYAESTAERLRAAVAS